MAATVLGSPKAVQMSLVITRAFVALRGLSAGYELLESQLRALEATVGEHDERLSEIVAALRDILTPPGPTGASIGDTVCVRLGADAAPRSGTVPPDLTSKFGPAAARRFAALSYSHQKEYVDWITSARKPETRRRVEETIKRLGAGSQPSR